MITNPAKDGYVNVPFLIQKREQTEYDLCLYLRSCVEGIMSIAQTGRDTGMTEALGTCVYELFENAIRYSTLNTEIQVTVKKTEEAFQVEVSNISDKEHSGKIIQKIEEMNKMAPLEFYLQQMKKKPAPGSDGGGGLGLARINHECGARLSAETKDTDTGHELKVNALIPVA